MPALLAAALLMQPVLAGDGHLRVVAVGTGGSEVVWTLDGAEVARTRDGEAQRIDAFAGPHELWARSDAVGRWRALARPEDGAPGGAQVVHAWTAVHEEEAPPGTGHAWLLPVGAAAASAAVLVRPRSVLQAWSRRRRT